MAETSEFPSLLNSLQNFNRLTDIPDFKENFRFDDLALEIFSN